MGILSQRQPGGRWDRRKWKLGLANESDTRGTIRVPFGLLVDHVKISEFDYNQSGLEFELMPLKHGSSLQSVRDQDHYLKVKLKVKRDSGKHFLIRCGECFFQRAWNRRFKRAGGMYVRPFVRIELWLNFVSFILT